MRHGRFFYWQDKSVKKKWILKEDFYTRILENALTPPKGENRELEGTMFLMHHRK